MKKLISFTLSLFLPAIIFAQDTSDYGGRAGIADVADSDPGLFMFMMIILTGFLASVIIGVFITVLAGLVLIALTAAGIVSFSVLLGVYRKSFYSGVKTFVYTSFTVVGASGATTAFFFFNILSPHYTANYYVLFATVAAGITGGVISGRLFLFVLNKTYRYVKSKLNSTI